MNKRHRRLFNIILNLLRRSGILLRRYIRQSLVFLVLFLFLDTVFILRASQPVRQDPIPTNIRREQIFIASLHWNGENLIRDHWAPAVLDLVRHFGKDNVYVSIIEGGSFDHAGDALKELDIELENLGVERSIALETITHADEVNRIPEKGEKGWIKTSRGKKELRRIPYLAKLRNRAMEKLQELSERKENKRRFDKVLWLNDIVFNTQDVLTLLSTNDGHYAAACSLDFTKPPIYYDTFALRDSSGAATISMRWPYFLSSSSRSSMQTLSPVPVQACWNGMVAFEASPFYSTSTTPALQFRGLPDSLAKHHLEASECCLIHADNPLSHQNGVYLNPNVRVGFNANAYKLVHPKYGNWPNRWQKVNGIWINRWARWTGWLRRYSTRKLVDRRITAWSKEKVANGKKAHHEVGGNCIINEMQVLVENGWLHL